MNALALTSLAQGQEIAGEQCIRLSCWSLGFVVVVAPVHLFNRSSFSAARFEQVNR